MGGPGPKTTPVGVRIEANIARLAESGCHVWTGRLDRHGYGQMTIDSKTLRVHRVNFILTRGPLLREVKLDHLCRNRACVNPDHLEPVTDKVNILRGDSPSAVNSRKTHCYRGHEFTLANTYHLKGGRCCRACGRIRASAYKAKKANRR